MNTTRTPAFALLWRDRPNLLAAALAVALLTTASAQRTPKTPISPHGGPDLQHQHSVLLDVE